MTTLDQLKKEKGEQMKTVYLLDGDMDKVVSFLLTAIEEAE